VVISNLDELEEDEVRLLGIDSILKYLIPSDEELFLIKNKFSPIFEYTSTRFEKIEEGYQEWYNLNEDKKRPNTFQFFKFPNKSWIVTYVPKTVIRNNGSWYCRDIEAVILLSEAFNKYGIKNCGKLSNSNLLEYIREYNILKILSVK
jgi:hypothetical protein